ncbi:MAG: T9SS type A sorting domain-containing protein [Saprospiraceae bacterium]|nr:MAG: T9SS type A sorting domain-containing protein [Saprospiraceae bacterium]
MRKIILFLLLYSGFARSQATYFNIQFDYNNIWNASASIIETDNFYITGGVFGTFSYDTAFLLKLDKSGEINSLWKTDFFPEGKIYDIKSSTNLDKIEISGRMNTNGFDDVINSDLFIVQLGLPFLDTLKVKTYGVPNFGDYSQSLVHRTSDGGFAVTGYRFAPGQKGKLLLLKTDSLLNQVFMKTYSKSTQDNHTGHSVVETPGKGFIVVGSRSFNTYDLQGTYLRVDSLGNQVWWKDIVPNGQEDEESIVLSDIARLSDGTFLVLGVKQYDIIGFPQYRVQLLLNINENGDVLWSKEYGSDIYEDTAWKGLTLCQDGNFITGGTKRENPYVPDQKAYGTIAKITPSGEVLWERKYSASSEGKFYDIFWRTIPTSDGGIIACGSTWGDSLTKENSWIVKLDSLGCLEPGCDSISTGVVELPVGDNSPIKLYPNPTGGHLTVEAQKGKAIGAVKIYDLQGRRLVNEEYGLGKASLSFDLSGQPQGMYFCSALVGGVWVTRQFVKH